MSEQNYEINLKNIVDKLFQKKWFIIEVTGIFIVIGIFMYFFNTKKDEYSATCTLIFQHDNYKSSVFSEECDCNNLIFNDNILPLEIYPQIVSGLPFLQKLMKMDIFSEDENKTMTYLKYYNDLKYNRLRFFDNVKKYTIGLSESTDGPENVDVSIGLSNDSAILFTNDELNCSQILRGHIQVNIDGKFVVVGVKMPEASVASGMVQNVCLLLQTYLEKLKTQKNQNYLEYLRKCVEEVGVQVEQKQQEIIVFNKSYTSSSIDAKLQKNRLIREYEALLDLSIALERQILQVNVLMSNPMPVLERINSVIVPVMSVVGGGNLFWIIAFMFFGFTIGIFLVLVLPFVAQVSDGKCFRRWSQEYNEGN